MKITDTYLATLGEQEALIVLKAFSMQGLKVIYNFDLATYFIS